MTAPPARPSKLTMAECNKIVDRAIGDRTAERRAWLGICSSLLTLLAGILGARAYLGHL